MGSRNCRENVECYPVPRRVYIPIDSFKVTRRVDSRPVHSEKCIILNGARQAPTNHPWVCANRITHPTVGFCATRALALNRHVGAQGKCFLISCTSDALGSLMIFSPVSSFVDIWDETVLYFGRRGLIRSVGYCKIRSPFYPQFSFRVARRREYISNLRSACVQLLRLLFLAGSS